MMVKQISVFIENKQGRLAHLTRTLADNDINLVALSIADTADFGILRAIVSDTQRASEVLAEHGFTVNVTEVLALSVPDRPGGLAGVLQELDSVGLSVEYLYSFVRNRGENALILFRVQDIQRAAQVLQKAGIPLLTQEELMQF